MAEPILGEHRLLVRALHAATHGECSCGRWSRDADGDTVAITGTSREEALRRAHELHARSLPDA